MTTENKSNIQRQDMIDERMDNWKKSAIESSAEPLVLICIGEDMTGYLERKLGMSDEALIQLLNSVIGAIKAKEVKKV